jgi:hypothetical protein
VYSIIILRRISGLALATFLITSAVVNAETVKFKANMNATQEAPPNDSKGKGTADVSFDTASKELNWTVTFEGLTGPATVAHFHGPAEPGKTAGVALSLGQNVMSPIKGKATLTDAQAADLMAGRWYVNVHTAAHGAGEIRGQVTK